MARAALGWGVRDIAAKASKSPTTIAKFERGDELLPDTIAAIRHAFEVAGVEFIGTNGVRLVKAKRRRKA